MAALSRQGADSFWGEKYHTAKAQGVGALGLELPKEIATREQILAKQKAWLAQMEDADRGSAFASDSRAWIMAQEMLIAQRRQELEGIPALLQAERDADAKRIAAARAAHEEREVARLQASEDFAANVQAEVDQEKKIAVAAQRKAAQRAATARLEKLDADAVALERQSL